MKTRSGFVSNSSSSSFIIKKEDISELQVALIKMHDQFADPGDEWEITEDEEYIKGSTWMDNFDMDYYLSNLNIDPADIEWRD